MSMSNTLNLRRSRIIAELCGDDGRDREIHNSIEVFGPLCAEKLPAMLFVATYRSKGVPHIRTFEMDRFTHAVEEVFNHE